MIILIFFHGEINTFFTWEWGEYEDFPKMIIFETALKWLYFKLVYENADNYINYPKVNSYNPT